MARKSPERGSLHLPVILALVLIIAVVGVYFLVASHADSRPTTTVSGAPTLTGFIYNDECANPKINIGEFGCYITLAPNRIQIAHGNYTPPAWGQLINFGNLRTNYTGRQVQIYAALQGSHSYTLAGSTAYYATLMPVQTTKFTGTITQDECYHLALPIGDISCYFAFGKVKVWLTPYQLAPPGVPWGQIIGFPHLGQVDYTGDKVAIYAQQQYSNTSGQIPTVYTLIGSASYYAQHLP